MNYTMCEKNWSEKAVGFHKWVMIVNTVQNPWWTTLRGAVWRFDMAFTFFWPKHHWRSVDEPLSQSFYLNAIEDLWVCEWQPKNLSVLEDFCKKEWSKIPQTKTDRLLEPRKVFKALILATLEATMPSHLHLASKNVDHGVQTFTPDCFCEIIILRCDWLVVMDRTLFNTFTHS